MHSVSPVGRRAVAVVALHVAACVGEQWLVVLLQYVLTFFLAVGIVLIIILFYFWRCRLALARGKAREV